MDRNRPRTTSRPFLWSILSVMVAIPAMKGSADADSSRLKSDTGERIARVLVVTGEDYPGHKWRETTPALVEALSADPRLDVRVMEDPNLLDSPALRRYDTLILHFMDWEQPAPGEEARRNLREFVQSGGGLVVVHFACGAFQDWPEFRNLAGRVWDPALPGHDPFGSFQVEIVDPDHPVTREMSSFETTDELYTCLTGDLPVDVLATAKSKVDGKDHLMAFAFQYGQGKVFHSPLGHDAPAFRNPNVAELFRRAAAWTAGLDPTAKRNPPASQEDRENELEGTAK